MNNNCVLSKSAILLRDMLDFPDVVARLVGQYSGFDQIYCPGDVYIRRERFGDSKQMKRVKLLRWIYRDLRSNFTGYEFGVYKVISCTPCSFKCEHLRTYYIYFKPRFMSFDIGRFVYCKENENRTHRLFRGTRDDVSTKFLYDFERIKCDFKKAIQVQSYFEDQLRFDVKNHILLLLQF